MRPALVGKRAKRKNAKILKILEKKKKVEEKAKKEATKGENFGNL